MSDLLLKILDPVDDIFFFQEAYGWRKEKRHAQPDRASFKDFTAKDERQIVVGVFNGDFLAAFLLYEWKEGGFYECHFTSKRGVKREILVQGGEMVRDAFFQNGAQELCAWITKRNTALRGYLEALGFQPIETKDFICQKANNGRTVSDEAIASREFVKYALKGVPPSG